MYENVILIFEQYNTKVAIVAVGEPRLRLRAYVKSYKEGSLSQIVEKILFWC